MIYIKTFAGTVFLIWLLFSPVLTFAVFGYFNDFWRSHAINFFWILGMTYGLLGAVGFGALKLFRRKIVGNQQEDGARYDYGFYLMIGWLIFMALLKLLR